MPTPPSSSAVVGSSKVSNTVCCCFKFFYFTSNTQKSQGTHKHALIGLSHYNVWRQRMPTYEKFRKNVGVRCIRWGYVFHKLRARYHTLAYADVRCHTSNLSENFVHAQNFQRMPTY